MYILYRQLIGFHAFIVAINIKCPYLCKLKINEYTEHVNLREFLLVSNKYQR